MYTIDLKKVEYPATLPDRILKEWDKRVATLVGQKNPANGEVLDRAGAEKLVDKKAFAFNPVIEFENTVINTLALYMQAEYTNAESKTIVAPYDVRKMLTRVRGKIYDAEDGVIQLSDEQYDFLKKALTADGQMSDYVIYIAEYVEGLTKDK